MITITSSNGDEKAIQDVFAAKGITQVAPEPTEAPVEVAEDKKPTGDTPVEGQEHSGSDPAKDKAEAEAEKPTQEKTEKPTEEAKPEEVKQKSKGGFQAKVEKLTAQADRLRDDLDAERGSKAKLQKELEEVNAKLAELQPKKEEPKAQGPEKPKRPTRAEFEFDEDKFEAALAEHEVKLDAYNSELRRLDREQVRQEVKAEAEKADAERQEASRRKAFADKVQAGAAKINDYAETLEDFPEGYETITDKNRVAHDYLVTEADNPAALMHFLMRDAIDNDGAETERLLALSPFRLVIELRAIEERIAKAVTATLEPEKPKVDTPAKPQPKPKQAVPDDPIEPVGGRHQPSPMNLEDQLKVAKTPAEYSRIRKQQQAAKQPARVA